MEGSVVPCIKEHEYTSKRQVVFKDFNAMPPVEKMFLPQASTRFDSLSEAIVVKVLGSYSEEQA